MHSFIFSVLRRSPSVSTRAYLILRRALFIAKALLALDLLLRSSMVRFLSVLAVPDTDIGAIGAIAFRAVRAGEFGRLLSSLLVF